VQSVAQAEISALSTRAVMTSAIPAPGHFLVEPSQADVYS